jgi:septal ring factor EnvC (AmiA/AmiB activator)
VTSARILFIALIACMVAAATFALSSPGMAQREAGLGDPSQTRAAYNRALKEQRAASERSRKLEAEAAAADEAAERTARASAARAARIQQAEAGVAAARARGALLAQARAKLRARLAEREEPLVRLTGALQTFSRRPLALSVMQPGSLKDLVYARAVLGATVPVVRERTGDLRAELARGRALEREARQATAALARSEAELEQRRKALAQLETRQRLASRAKGAVASRESERALALAEQARDLDALVGDLEEAGRLRGELAALPGPVLRPARPAQARISAQPAHAAAPTPSTARALRDYQLPVNGRTLTGFGAIRQGRPSEGIVLGPIGRAQVVAPGTGRVAFAGPYRGYGRIVIIDHGGGWTSLVTGLARVDAQVGDEVVAGSPLGIAPPGNPAIALELRRGGTPVNPLDRL